MVLFCNQLEGGGVGFVVRDHTGSMLAGGAWPMAGLLSAEHAEALACSKALNFALEQGYFPTIIETDALEVQRQIFEEPSSNLSALG